MNKIIDVICEEYNKNNVLFEIKDNIKNRLDKLVDIKKKIIKNNSLVIRDNNEYVKELKYRDNDIEIYLIKWGKESETVLHKHPKKGCIFYVISGKLTEKIVDNNFEIKTHELYEGNINYIDDNIGMHKVIGVEESLTIHIYSPPIFYD